MPDIVVQQVTRTGLVAEYTALIEDEDYLFSNNGNVILHFQNGPEDAQVVIIVPGQIDGMPHPPRPLNITANSQEFFGDWPPGIYNKDHFATVNVRAAANLSVAALRI